VLKDLKSVLKNELGFTEKVLGVTESSIDKLVALPENAWPIGAGQLFALIPGSLPAGQS
jgi:hypothetical protein